MFNKKYICLLLIILMGLVAISAVGAADDNATEIVSMDENDEITLKSTNEDILSADNNNEVLSASPTFKDLNETINGNTDSVINLSENYGFDSNVDGAFKKGIVINRDLTINGNGHEINAYGQANIFNVVGSSNVVFKNISFVKSFGAGNGAVSGGTSINCNFTDCAAMSKEGGSAIYKGTAINCTFSKNMVIGGGFGGAIYQGYAINCTFSDNSASGKGGAMYGGSAVDCVFIGNRANSGGAIYETVARNCNFTSNYASNGIGGAASDSDCFNCIFTQNSAAGGGAGEDGSYYDCTFINNAAINGASGGALYYPVIAVNCTFINNTANSGSAIYEGTAVLCKFINNTCDDETDIYDYPTIEANDFECIYNAKEVFEFKLMAGETEVKYIKTTLALYSAQQLINEYHLVSGESWLVDLEPGSYNIKLSIDSYPEAGVKNVSLNVLRIPISLALNVTYVSTNPTEVTYVLATLKDYNNAPLGNVNLTVDLIGQVKTDGNGQAVIPIIGLSAGTSNVNIRYDGDRYYNESTAVLTVDVAKLPTEIFSDDSVWIPYNTSSRPFEVTLRDNNKKPVRGVNITVNLNGTVEDYITDENGTIKIPTVGLMPGVCDVALTFEGNEVYKNSSNRYTLHIEQVSVDLNGYLQRGYNLENLTANDLIVKLLYFDSDKFAFLPLAGREVRVDFNGANNTYTSDENGEIRVPTNGLAIGNYTAKLSFEGDNIYRQTNSSAHIRIIKSDSKIYFPTFPFYAHYGSGDMFELQLKDGDGNPIRGINTITVSLNGERNYTSDENGTVFISSNGAFLGAHWAYITFAGNENYTNSSNFLLVNVSQGDPILSSNNFTTTYNSNEKLVITLRDSVGSPIGGWKLTVDLYGIQNYTTDENGQIFVPIKGIATGNHSAKVTCDLGYAKGSYTANFTINRAPIYVFGSELAIRYGEEGYFNITLMDQHYNKVLGINTVNVNITARNHDYKSVKNYSTDENGTISIFIKDFAADAYLVTMTFYGNENFTAKTNYDNIIVKRWLTELSSDGLTTVYNSGKNLTVALKDSYGKPLSGCILTVNLNGIKEYITDDKGQIYVPVNGVAAGNYSVNITFNTNYGYWESSLTANLTIDKAYAIVSGTYLNTKYGDDSWFNITLTCKGELIRGINTVYVQLDERTEGKNYTTDENGTIRISTKEIPAEYYWVKMTFNGNENYTESTNYGRLKINKKDTALSSDNIITSYNSGENLLVTLKDIDGKPLSDLTLTVNLYGEKDYITDENGTIKVPTEGLYPSDYLVFVSFKENQNYTGSDFIAIISVIKTNTTIEVNDVIDENNVEITVEVDINATGIVKFEINGPEHYIVYSDIENGKATSHHILSRGNYTVNVSYDGNTYFNSNFTSKEFTVIGHIKKDTAIVSSASVDGYTVTITTTVDSNATGNVTIAVLGQKFIVPVNSGKAVFTYDFAPDAYDVEVTYLGDYNFNANSTTVPFTVIEQSIDLKNTTISVDVTSVENDVTITAKIDPSAGGLIEFNIDGKAVYIAVNNGEASYNLVLPTGEYSVDVTYLGNFKFNGNTTSANFTVVGHVKKDTPIKAVPTIDGNTVTIATSIDENATGHVTVSVLGRTFLLLVDSGKAVFTYDFFPGSYVANVAYLGDDDFNEAHTTVSFTVIKQETVLKDTPISVDVVSVENNVAITATVDNATSGLIEFNIAGNAVYLAVNNGKATYNVVLPAGDYNVDVTYLGDDKFNANRTSKQFTVLGHVKNNTEVESVARVDGYTVTITTNVNPSATGNVTIAILGQTFIVPIDNGKAVFTYDFAPGTYCAEVTYLGDYNFNANSTIVPFTVIEQAIDLKNTTISVNVTSIYNEVTITAIVNSSASGLVEFNIDGKVVYIALNSGKAIYTTSLPAGSYSVNVTYLGDFKFNSNKTSKAFNVTDHVKKNTTLTPNVIIDGYDVEIAVTLDKNATGFVEFILNGESVFFKVMDGEVVFAIVLLPGNYTITANYLGDSEFNANTTDIEVNIAEIQLNDTYVDANIAVNENNVTVTVNVNPNATGFVEFNVTGGENYVVYVKLQNGVAVLDDVLTAGEYAVKVTYLGDSNFNANSTTKPFTVVGHIKKDTPISSIVTVEDYTVTITANVDSNATGFVTIAILNQTFIVPVENGKAVFTYDFAPGIYGANITYLGDDDFNNATATASFTVTEQPIQLKNTTISVDVTSVENDVTITANVNPMASGLIEFNIEGNAVYIAVNNGKAVYTTSLPGGNYNVAVTYLGDFRFNANRTSKAFNVTDHIKKNTTMTPIVEIDGYEVTIGVAIDKNATGFVEFTLYGESIFAKVSDGKAQTNTQLPPGNYTFTVTYLGDDDFNANVTDIEVIINEIPLNDTAVVANVGIDENNVTITVNVDSNATGFVKFNVTGAENYVAYVKVEDGVAVLDDVLAAGNYNVEITYLGDENFYSNSTNESFTVIGHVKNNTTLSYNIQIRGYAAAIAVKVNKKATGFVEFEMNGRGVFCKINNGIAVLYSSFTPGNYTIRATYLGDDDFNANTTYINVKIDEIPLNDTSIDADIKTIENNVTITVNVDSKAIGFIKFNVTGAENYVAYVKVENGVAVLEDVLAIGDYTVEITYLGDQKFNENSTTETFHIAGHIKNDTGIKCNVEVVANSVKITVNVNESATGFVELVIAGKKYYAPVNDGKAVIASDFLAGTYAGNVKYLGDDNFNTAITLVSFTVVEQNITLNDTFIELDIGAMENDITIKVNVNESATGLVEIKINETTVYIPVNNGEAIYDIVLAGGEYNISVTYMGDARFNPNSTSKTFKVSDHVKVNTTISNNVVINGYEVTVTVNVDKNATGFVEFAIMGKKHYAPVIDGKAVLVYEFSPSTYAGYATYLGDDNFNSARTLVFFTIDEQNVTLNDTFVDVAVGAMENDVTILVKVNESASGLVEIRIGDRAVYVPVNNGEAVYDVVLAGGQYTATVTYMGDARFNSNSTVKTFNVSDHVKLNTTVKCDVAIAGNTVTVTVNVNESATGFVELVIAGKKYYAPVNDGKAVIASDFLAGTYAGNVNYLGDDNFNPAGTLLHFTVIEQNITLDNTTLDVNVYTIYNDVGVIVNVNVNATGLVEFIIGDEAVYVPIINGVAVYSTTRAAGNHTVYVTYLGDLKFNPNSTSKQFTVYDHIKQNTTMAQEILVNDTNVTITVNVNPNATGLVIFEMNNLNVSVTVRDGKAVLNNIFEPGNYNITAVYLGDNEFNANTTQILFAVNKFATVITASKLTTTYGTGKNLIITLTDDKGNLLIGKNVTVNLNGNIYNGVTDAKGQLTVAVPANLAPQTYIATIAFAGDVAHVNSTGSVEVVVAKATPKITAKKKSYKKSKKTKKYKVTLKSGKNPIKKVKVTLKIKGKTYKAKTNAKGKATFKIKKLTKKGKYKAVVKFKGNRYYNAVSKKVKIIVK